MWLFKRRKNSVDGKEVLVGEEEEDKKNFSLITFITGKLGFPVNTMRITDSLNSNTNNTNVSLDPNGEVIGVNYSHAANNIVAAPAAQKAVSTYSVSHTIKKMMPWSEKVTSRTKGRGR